MNNQNDNHIHKDLLIEIASYGKHSSSEHEEDIELSDEQEKDTHRKIVNELVKDYSDSSESGHISDLEEVKDHMESMNDSQREGLVYRRIPGKLNT